MLVLAERRAVVLVALLVSDIAVLDRVDGHLDELADGRPHGQRQQQRDETPEHVIRLGALGGGVKPWRAAA